MQALTPKLFTLLKSGYSRSDLKSDAIAGLTVAIIALPLAMALAIASGTSPDKGLITAVIAGFLISFLGGSRVQIGGPTGAFVVVVFDIIAKHGYEGLILATFMAGTILILGGYAKLGRVIKFIPHPVVTGFTAGIAVIIASSQVKDFLGLKMAHVPSDFIPKWIAYFKALETFNPITITIGLATLLVMIFLRRFAPRLPAYLIAISISAIIAAIFQIPIETIGSRFPDIPNGLPMPKLPVWDFAKIQNVVPSAFTIAFLAGIESLLSAVVADGMTGYKHRSNQELIGQGIANIASSLFGGLPATGAIARTATNIKAGGKTPMAGIFHAIFLLLFMLFAMDVISFIPMAALAAVLFVVSWGMSEIDHFIHIFRLSWADRTVMMLTFLLTILVDLPVAIAVGVTLASLLFMKHMVETVQIKSEWRKLEIYDENDEYETQRGDLPEGVEVFQITGPFFFGVASHLIDALKSMGQTPKVLILRMRLVPYLDATGERALESVIKQCSDQGAQIILSGLQPQPMQILRNAGVKDREMHVVYCENYATALKESEKILNKEM
ncbi:putative sulfate transporter yvdB [Waddlia chondrophila 2032/99]|uniref:Putative high affinity sulfate transporter, sulfate permease family n=2 Tax=Waddlia chondrophila TaxID=71667 RepID=D6YU02_WADCW|nr:sulfate permease [Waddlia chondrophila]ADI37613.1 putative high affinity sulfate transporter, sulfate permease family [Waddlia chondrophila WSU 86-1044]CCB91040.1 putative sulfate transporter yvdB [Waddlia chondrophila 2032/99]